MLLTKIEVAKMQLNTALRLWFMDDDPVSTHTLVGASLEVISDLLENVGVTDFFYNSSLIRPDLQNEFNRLVRANMNFFKHADRDPNEKSDFNPNSNLPLLIFSVFGMQMLGEPIIGVQSLFLIWLGFHTPDFISDEFVRKLNDVPDDITGGFRRMSKAELYESARRANRKGY